MFLFHTNLNVSILINQKIKTYRLRFSNKYLMYFKMGNPTVIRLLLFAEEFDS